MKWLPLLLAGLHGSLVIVLFGAAYLRPERSGLAPVLLIFTDFPISCFIEWLRKSFHGDMAYLAAF